MKNCPFPQRPKDKVCFPQRPKDKVCDFTKSWQEALEKALPTKKHIGFHPFQANVKGGDVLVLNSQTATRFTRKIWRWHF